METPSPEQQALQNPIILQTIFQNESLSTKNLRLVCNLWNEIILSLPQPKLSLRLTKRSESKKPSNCCDAVPFQTFCVKMEPKLAKCIIDYGCQKPALHSPSQRSSTAASRLLHVCDKFSQIIEEVTITFVEADFVPTLYEILQNCCPNLKKVELYFRPRGLHDEYMPSQSMIPLRVKPKLTSIRIVDPTAQFLKMTQMIINSAPNLTRFFYHGKRYPNLSRRGTVKWIQVDMSRMKLKDISNCGSTNGLNEMLDHVKNHLRVLVIANNFDLHDVQDNINWGDDDDWNDDSDHEDNVANNHELDFEDDNWDDDVGIELSDEDDEDYDIERIAFKIPKMKSLKMFENHLVDGFTCGDALQDICTARLPALETLKLSSAYLSSTNMDDLLQNAMRSKNLFTGVKNLHLTDVRDPKSIIGLGQVFTNLETLSIRLLNNGMEDRLGTAVEWVGLCEELFARGLKNCTMEIVPMGIEVDLLVLHIERMKQCLLLMKKVKNVSATIKCMKFKEETWKWMDPFIRDNKIPIKFETLHSG
ncbi:uncharacterized protein LOC110850369 [Folsomia candida]|uniref:F-box domain-containing protein n=1 Tax=Folsomia candida TaxID=158441 RepID=A0A226E9P9_FOLCA|nr:uncharacterized protein LOC110850369 [Folsomia candida]OXA54342.1 hypothetical protein Fcan01_10842 [Folsomia candida]